MKDITILNEKLRKFNIQLNQEQLDQFSMYYNLLIEWNHNINLTSITEFDDVVEKHFVDSLSLCTTFDLSQNIKLIDVGTGAGFPGIPLKIAFPQIEILLLDSLNKRVNFLNHVIKSLELTNISAIHARAEEYGNDINYREKYDICVSRAVANLSTLSEYCIPFVKVEGFFVPYKSGKINDELENAKYAITMLGAEIIKTEEFILPNSDIERSLVMIQKNNLTPKKYPRLAGKPSKDPLMDKGKEKK